MSNLQLLYLVLIFLTVAFGVFGLANIFFRPRMLPERLKGDGEAESADTPAWQAKLVKLAEPLAKAALPEDGLDYSELRSRFLNAGFRNRSAIGLYVAAKLILALGLPLLLVMTLGLAGSKASSDMVLYLVLIAAGIGFFIPNLFLNYAIKRRQRALFEAFPDATDLLVVCVEAGLGLDAAIARASQEIRVRCPDLADELHLVILELRVGASREQALRNLAVRTGLEEASALVTMLVQADRFGTNVAEALRVHADSLRYHRQMQAEAAAAKVPVKLVFPVVLCIFPALMLVLGGPPAISIYRNLFPAIAQ